MIHSTAQIGPNVELGVDVSVGPYTVIEGEVQIGDGTRIGPRVHVLGWTTIGGNCKVHAGAVIGDEPQDHDYHGEKCFCRIGDDTIVREYATIHRATGDGNTTSIGDHCMIMGFAHVGHNVTVGDHCNIGNHTVLAGYVMLEDRCNLSGYIGVHQFCRIGTMAMVGGYHKFTQDIPPFALVDHGLVYGPNAIGLKRAGIKPDARKAIQNAFKTYYSGKMMRSDALAELMANESRFAEVDHFIEFIRSSKRGVIGGNRPVTSREPGRQEAL